MGDVNNWTPEPWAMDDTHCQVMTPNGGRYRIDGPHAGDRIVGMSETDFARAVACVNACSAIPTDALAGGVVPRGELEQAVGLLRRYIDSPASPARDEDLLNARSLRLEIRAFLARHRPQPEGAEEADHD